MQNSTTFILGAGSSYDYGMPLGQDLLNSIIHKKWDQHDISDDAREEFNNFSELLRDTKQYSIDSFLSQPHRKGMSNIGKIMIARILCPLENNAFKRRKPDDKAQPLVSGWYKWFINKALPQGRPTTLGVNIITFNYDRTLEIAIARSLISDSDMNPKEALHAAAELPILHVYGTLGKLNTIQYDPEKECFYYTYDDWNSVSAELRVVGEERRLDDDVEKRIRQVVQKSDTLVFLGFGFDKDNLSILGFSPYEHGHKENQQRVYALGYGVTSAEKKLASIRLGKQGGQMDAMPVVWSDKNEDCLSFLRENVIIERP